MISVNDKVEETIREFICEFIEHPYLCYTEHGQHARFYQMLYEALDDSQRYVTCMGQKVCSIQKEYPTAGKLGKPRRQHWDIAIIKSPDGSAPERKPFYDYLKVETIVEFGMNTAKEHLEDDIERVCHRDANTDHKYIVHLYRLSKAGEQFSMRDRSPSSTQILKVDQVKAMTKGKLVSIFYGMYNDTDKSQNGAWLIKDGEEPKKVICNHP